MKVLFFAEPFPVRGQPLDFQWVVSRWLSVSQGLVRLGATPLVAVSDAIKAARPDAAPWLLSPADLGVRPHLSEDPAQLDAEWVRLMTDPDMPPWRDFVEVLLDRTRPDAVVSWTMNAPLRAATSARGIVLMHQELGPMRPPNPMLYFADPQGVNGGSSVSELWPQVREQPLTPEQEQELEWLRTEAMAPSPLSREEISRRLGLVPGRRVLAVFLQVPRDSNILVWSRLRAPTGLLELVTAATSPDSHHVLVRPHPAHAVEPEVAASHVQVVKDLPAEALLEVADAVLTINSSVGLEALARGKVVYTFGDSPYAGRGCTRDLGPEPAQLREALATLPFTLTEQEERLRHRLLHFLVFRYLVPEWEAWSPEVMLGRLERWKRLLERGAPREEWFAPEVRGARLGMLRAEKTATRSASQLEQVSAQLAAVQAERDAARAQLASTTEALQAQVAEARAKEDSLGLQLAIVERELEELRRSAGHRVLSLARRLPVIYPGYLRAKRLLNR